MVLDVSQIYDTLDVAIHNVNKTSIGTFLENRSIQYKNNKTSSYATENYESLIEAKGFKRAIKLYNNNRAHYKQYHKHMSSIQ